MSVIKIYKVSKNEYKINGKKYKRLEDFAELFSPISYKLTDNAYLYVLLSVLSAPAWFLYDTQTKLLTCLFEDLQRVS